ncbi:MAG: hypothetical protein LC799_12240, partial [Actinobacteria bacterium]|nr:hypothetical protein [Actinomycetota bacterium]
PNPVCLLLRTVSRSVIDTTSWPSTRSMLRKQPEGGHLAGKVTPSAALPARMRGVADRATDAPIRSTTVRRT